MPIVNFNIPVALEKEIGKAIKEKGFASKAEFFRFLALDYIQKLNRDLAQEEFDFIMKGLTDSIAEHLRGKKLPSLDEQMAAIKERLNQD